MWKKINPYTWQFDFLAEAWEPGPAGASIVSAEFSGDDILFTKSDTSTVTLADAKIELKWDDWAPGADGAPGAPGANWTNGTNGIDWTDWTDGISFTPKWPYSAGTAYVPNDVVSYNGSSWIALQNTTGNTPSEWAYWTLCAAKGTDGTGSGDISGSGTANELAYFTGEKTIDNLPTSTYPSLTELSYVKWVTSAIQTQLWGKASTAAASTSAAWLAPQATAPASWLYNYLGITNWETVYTNKALFDATAPSTQAYGDSAATGSAAVAARRDHKHAMPASTKDTTAVTGILKGNWTSVSAAASWTDYVAPNVAITWATKTKITYDAKGLVTGGADATTADIADSTNKRYVTDAQLTVIWNTSNTNTWDNATNSQYSGLAASKQDTLVSGTNIKTINSTSLLGSGNIDTQNLSKATWAEVDTGTDDTKYVTAKAMEDSSYMKNPMTTAGDIIYGWTSWTPTRLAKGTAGQVLKMNSGETAPEWWTASWGTSLRTAITGTRASNTTITVATDLKDIFKKGMIVRRQESGVDKVGMVSIPSTYSSPSTTITIIWDTCASIDTDTFKYSSIIWAEQFIKNFAYAGTVWATGTDVMNAYYANEPYRVIGAEINAWVVWSNSGNTVVNIKKWSTTMFTTKPTLAYNALTTATPFTADSATSLALNDRVTIDIDWVCTTTFHQDLYIKLYLLPTRYLSLT